MTTAIDLHRGFSSGDNGSQIPPQYPGQERTVQDTWHVLMRNRTLIILCTLLVIAAAATWAYLTTPVYEASTSIRVDEEKSKIPALDELQALSSGSSDLVTEMEVLKSRNLAENVIDSLGLRAVMSAPSRVQRSDLFSVFRVDRTAPIGQFDIARIKGGKFRVTTQRTGTSVGPVAQGEPVTVDGVTFALHPAALEYPSISFDVIQEQEAVK